MIIFDSHGFVYFKYLTLNNSSFLSKKIDSKLSLEFVWKHMIGCGSCGYYVNLCPVFENSYIFVFDYYRVVKKLNIYTGQCIWKNNLHDIDDNARLFRSSELFLSCMSIAKNRLYIGTELAKVYALDIMTGTILWTARISGEVISKPVISHGLVLLHTSNGFLEAINEQDGILKWSINLGGGADFSFRVTSVPVISSNILIFGDSNGIVSAFCIDSGDLIWQKKVSNIKGMADVDRLSNIVSTVVVNNIVYAVAYNGNMIALDIFSGDVIWSKDIGSLIGFKIEDSTIYLLNQDNCVVVLNVDNGNILWCKQYLKYFQFSSMTLYQDYILLGDEKGYIHFLCKKNGSFLKKIKISNSSVFSPIVIFLDKVVVYDSHGQLSVWNIINKNL